MSQRKIQNGNQKHLENENTTHLNLWNATKAVLRRKFTVLVSDFRKEARERTSET